MEDFYRLYQDLPLPDLVKVARTPSDYLPEAVAAAEKILRERGVTREQITAEEWVIAQKEIADGLRRGRLREYTAWIGELFGGDRMTPKTDRWLTVLLIVYALYYTFNMFVVIRQLAWVLRRGDVSYGGSLLVWDLCFATYITICLYCVLKQVWLGWSLLLVHAVVFTCMKLSLLFRVYAHHNFFLPVYFSQIVMLLLFAGAGVILLRPYVQATFAITDAIRNRTLLAAAFVGLATLFF